MYTGPIGICSGKSESEYTPRAQAWGTQRRSKTINLACSVATANHPGKGTWPMQSQLDCRDFQNGSSLLLTGSGPHLAAIRGQKGRLCENRAEVLEAEPRNKEKLNSNLSLKPIEPEASLAPEVPSYVSQCTSFLLNWSCWVFQH